MITHEDGTPDKRYTFGKEFTGHISAKPRYVARFCGEWLGDSADISGAVLIAEEYEKSRWL